MRLSQLCHLEDCGVPHSFTASHMVGPVRFNFCCASHQELHLRLRVDQRNRAFQQMEERYAPAPRPALVEA
jgi:hypothetical protein